MPFQPKPARDFGDHRLGAAEKKFVVRADSQQPPIQRRAFAVVDAAVEDVGGLPFAAHHVDPLKAVEIGVFQKAQFLAEQHRMRAPIAVQQRDATERLVREHAADDRHVRRDAATGGDAQIAAWPRRIERRGEVAGGRRHVDRHTHFEAIVDVVRKTAAFDAPDRDHRRLVADHGADRVRTREHLAVDSRAQRQILAVFESVRIFQFVRYAKPNRGCVVGQRARCDDRKLRERSYHRRPGYARCRNCISAIK